MNKKTHSDLMKELEDLVHQHGTASNLAKRMGISPQYLNDILHGRREIGKKVLGVLGYKKVVMFVREDTLRAP